MSESLRHFYENISICGIPLEKEIENNIEKYRKGDFKVELPDGIKAERIKVKQIKSDFMFGANTFMLDSFNSNEQNDEYKEKFLKLFNTAVVGTFWRDYEPEKGKYRFEKTVRLYLAVRQLILYLNFAKKTV